MVSALSALSLLASISLLAGQHVTALSAAEWRSRTIYQVMTDRFALTDGSTPACDISIGHFCGGSLEGIINKLDYIQGLGFDAIWISPVAQQIPNSTAVGEAYHRYWPADLFSVESPTALTSLVTALHGRGMALMLDVVVNDVAWPLKRNDSQFDPTIGESIPGVSQDGLYGVLDRAEDYHRRCVIDYDNATSVQECWFSDPGSVVLADLNTQSPRIRKLHQDWIFKLVSTYQIDGIRIDAAKHVEMDFWKGYTSAAGVYCVGEVLDGNPYSTPVYQTIMDGILNYPMWYPLFRAFTAPSGALKDLSDMISTINYQFSDPSLLGTFVSNHDQPRPRSYVNDTALLQNLFAFPFLSDGIPITYYGDEQSGSDGSKDPMNREAMWQLGSSPYDTTGEWYAYHGKLNAIRRAAATYSLNFYSNLTTPLAPLPSSTSPFLLAAKGPLLSIFSNLGSTSSPYTLSFTSRYASKTTVVELMTCTKAVVGPSGTMEVTVRGGKPQVYLPLCAVTPSSGLCPAIASTISCADRVASRLDPSR